jgi:putative hemolysin
MVGNAQAPRQRQVQTWIGLVLGLATVGGIVVQQCQSVAAPLAGGDPGAASYGFGPVLVVIGVIILNAFFVAGETASDLLKPMHVKHLRERNEKQSKRLQVLVDDRLTYVAACQLGRDLARLLIFLMVLLIAPGLTREVGWEPTYVNYVFTAFLVMIPVGLLNLIFELVPRSYASLHPHGTAMRLFGFIRLSALLFSVPAKMATGLANLITARFGGRASFVIANQAEEEIKTIVESAQESGEIEVDEKELLHSVFEFTDTVAREVMTPRVDIDAMPITSTPNDLMNLIKESGHSRIPLYEQTDDQIVGIIHAKDLLMAMLNGSAPNVRDLLRPAIFVPENKNLHELLAEMRATRSQMVVVQDEFGGTAGIVTIEDIVEELVGDIVDEYDIEEPEVVDCEGGWIAHGRTHLDDINDRVGSEFSSEEFDTVGGLVFGLFGRQPRMNEGMESQGYRFTVIETDGRRIHKLRIDRIADDEDGSSAEGQE